MEKAVSVEQKRRGEMGGQRRFQEEKEETKEESLRLSGCFTVKKEEKRKWGSWQL